MSAAPPFVPPSKESLAQALALTERSLSAEEAAAYVNAPMSAEEESEILDLVRWFTTRYPTVAERMAYVRRRRRTGR